jgi:hypothetical protein
MKNKSLIALLLLAVAPLLFVGCTPEVEPLVVNDSLLVGKWVKESKPQEYWRYDAEYTGET